MSGKLHCICMKAECFHVKFRCNSNGIQGEHSAIFSAFIKLPFSIKTFILSIFKWPVKTGFIAAH